MSTAVQALPACIVSTFDVKQMKERSRSTMQAAARYEARQRKLENLRKPGPYALEVALFFLGSSILHATRSPLHCLM
jgi:hypothetical protein